MTTAADSTNWKPEMMGTVSMLLCFEDRQCAEAIKAYENVLGAKLVFPPVTMGDPEIISHAVMQIGETTMMMHDFYEEGRHRGSSAAFVYVPDVDAACKLAKEAGFKINDEPKDMFWGDRIAHTIDPFGHYWTIATMNRQVSEEELEEGKKAMAEKFT